MPEPQEIEYVPFEEEDRAGNSATYRGEPLTEEQKAKLRRIVREAEAKDARKYPGGRSVVGRRAE